MINSRSIKDLKILFVRTVTIRRRLWEAKLPARSPHKVPLLKRNTCALEMGFSTRQRPETHQQAAQSWFQTNRVQVMEWPTQSPDLSPIENLWADIKNAVYEAKPRNAEELWNVVQSSWAAVPVDRCQKLVDPRCEAVIRNHSYATKY